MVSSIKAYNPMSAYSKALKKIESSGIRPTRQRRVLAKIIFEKGYRHLSAEELYNDVKKIMQLIQNKKLGILIFLIISSLN